MRPGQPEPLFLKFSISARDDRRVQALMAEFHISRAEAGRRYFTLGVQVAEAIKTTFVKSPKESSCPEPSSSSPSS